MIAIQLEGANGVFLTDAQYDTEPRPFAIAYQGYWFEQNRRKGDVWVYRQVSPTPYGELADDPVLTLTPLAALTLASLDPVSATIGGASFTLRVLGTGFDGAATIVFAGHTEPTTWVETTELTTGVDMSVWLGPDPAIPVLVRNSDGKESTTKMFAMQASKTAAA